MKRKWFAVPVFLITLIVYLLTLAPSLASFDGASWIVDSLFAGLPPVPGNLFYLLVCSFAAKLYAGIIAPLLIWIVFTADAVGLVFRPSLEPAVGVNLVSALSGAGSAALVFVLLDRFLAGFPGAKARPDTGGRLLLAAGTVGMALLPALWSVSIVAGPAAFNLLAVLFWTWLLMRIEEGSRPGTNALILSLLAGSTFSHSGVFLAGALITVIFLLRGKNTAAALRANTAPAVLLFLLGLTLYTYVWVRPAVVAGLGEPIQPFTKPFWNYFFNTAALRASFARSASFFSVQFPLLLGQLKAQSFHWIVGIVLLVAFHYGLIQALRRLRALAVAVLIVLAYFLAYPLWMVNPMPATVARLESGLLPVVVIMSGFILIGIVSLKGAFGILPRVVTQKFELRTSRLENSTVYTLTALLAAVLVSPVVFGWKSVDMSGYYVIRDLGANQLAGIEKDGIIVLLNDREFSPALYADRVLLGESGRTLLNYSLMSSPRYLKQLKATGTVPMTLDDRRIETIGPVKLAEAETYEAGKLKVNYPKDTIFLVGDLALKNIIAANAFKRPFYYSSQIPPQYQLGLTRYMALRGMAIRLFEEDPTTSTDSTNYWRQDAGSLAVDIPWTQQLLWGYYRFSTTLWKDEALRGEKAAPLVNYARLYANLAEAYLGKKNAEAAGANFKQCEFFDTEYRDRMLAFSTRLAAKGCYPQSKEFASTYFKLVPPDPLKWAGLAKIALDNRDTIPATELLLESIKADPDFLLGYQKLIRLFDSMGKNSMVSAFLSRWLARHPNDQETRRLWEEYSSTKTLPPDFPQ